MSGSGLDSEAQSNSANPRYVLPETVLLTLIGCLDLLSTIYFVATKQAFEANPLFARLLYLGPWLFTLAKALFLAIPLAFAEYARRHNEQFVRLALRLGIILYLGLYAIAFAKSNIAQML